ncbi:MAG: hypothetical protein FJX75_18295 [Armatimonadetes bacterium]|nr:hypothetical protein [Armatimonadota bacterium]
MYVLLLVFAIASSATSQGVNLVSNPGFETGTEGFAGLWVREPGAGTASVVADNPHDGAGCLRIEHTGEKDWSFSQAARAPVLPGEVLRLGGWARVERPGGRAELSVILHDAQGQAISWSFCAAQVGSSEAWTRLERRAVVPEGVAAVTFRIMGSGPLTACFDDLFLVKEGSVREMREKGGFPGHTLDTEAIRLHLRPDLTFDVADKRTGNTWESALAETSWIVIEANLSDRSASLRARTIENETQYDIAVAVSGQEASFTISAPPDAMVDQPLTFPPPLQSREGDYAIVPYAEGLVLPVAELDLKRDLWYEGYKTTMAWCGITNLTDGHMALLATPADGGLLVRPQGPKEAQRLGLATAWIGEKGRFGYPRTVVYVFLAEGGHTAMAQRYRQWAEAEGYVKPFRDKLQDRPHLDRLLGAVDFWGRKGTNDAAFYRELRSLGIDRAICSLGGGWIPPKGVSDLVRELNAIGYLPSHYDIYTDVWPGSENDEPKYARKHGYPDDVYVNADGSLRKGWVIRAKDAEYQGYYICSSQHAKEAIPRISADLAENPYTCRFIDVITAMGPSECYSDAHPLTRSQDIEAKRSMLGLVSSRFALVTGSEECRDWAMAVTDYGEGTMTIRAASNAGYDWSTPVEPDAEYVKLNADGRYRAPLHGLAFHDCHVATWYTGDGATKVPAAWPKKDLLNILYGAMPLWMPDADLWAKYRTEFVRSYFRVCPVFRAAGYDRMVSHEFLTADRRVQRTRFSGGVTVIGNFGPEPHELPAADSPTGKALTLPEAGYAVGGPALVSYRAEIDGGLVEYVETGDRACVHSADRVHDGGALAAQGTVIVAHGGEGPFVVVLEGTGPIALRENGPLAGRSLAKAYVVATNAAGETVEVASQAAPRTLTLNPMPGIERCEIRYRQGTR